MNEKTVRVAPERLERWLDGFAERHGESVYDAAPDVVTVRAEDSAVARIAVPFPPLRAVASEEAVARAASSSDARDRLTAHVLVVRRVGVLLVRRGGHGAGVFEGAKLVDSKVGSRHVQGGTKAGGWSQQRFARRRENQAREAFAAAADVAARILLPAKLDALVCGGDRKAVDTVLADPRLDGLKQIVQPPFLGVPDPRQRVLEQAGADARAVRIDLTEPAG